MSHARALGYIGVHGAAMLGCRNITASTVSSLVRAGFLCQSSDPKVDGWALVPYDHPSAINPFWA